MSSAFEIEEELDPSLLGLDIDETMRPSLVGARPGPSTLAKPWMRPRLPPRVRPGRYLSADWEPPSSSTASMETSARVSTPSTSPIPPSSPMALPILIPRQVKRSSQSPSVCLPQPTPPAFIPTAAFVDLPISPTPSPSSPHLIPPDLVSSIRAITASPPPIGAPADAPSTSTPRRFTVHLVRIPRPGRKPRMGLRIRPIPPPPPPIGTTPAPLDPLLPAPLDPLLDTELDQELDRLSQPPEDPPPPEGSFLHPLFTSFGPAAVATLDAAAVSTIGPAAISKSLGAFLETLHAPGHALKLVNAARVLLDLPPLVLTKRTKPAFRRELARFRARASTEILAGLTLPGAPTATDADILAELEAKKAAIGGGEGTRGIRLTPSNLKGIAKELPRAFAKEKKDIEALLRDGVENIGYGDAEAKVVWEGGVGRCVGGMGGGFRGHVREEKVDDPGRGRTHVFVDHSNILFGLLTALSLPSTSDPNASPSLSHPSTSLPPKHLRILSLPALSLLLRRAHPTPSSTLHCVASSPLPQPLDPLVRLGWECSVMKRVELSAEEVVDPLATSLTPRATARVIGNDEGRGIGRYKEQGVDELLHLKILQAINAGPGGEGEGRLILATGDARGGQFNKDGFLGAVREGVSRGWKVEVWSFRAGLSRLWHDTAKREGWYDTGRFKIHELDRWKEWLVEVGEEDDEEI